MSDVCEKLVMLALSSENVDEAVAALRKARKLHPYGKLPAVLNPDWDVFQRERAAFVAERDVFEEERAAFQRNLFGKRKPRRSAKSMWRDVNRRLFGLRRPAGLATFGLVYLGGAAYGLPLAALGLG